ncbi:MAG: FAD-binding protein [Clostridia bacterium]|nr:FAD-binding protein [Clostridia bacterium]
MKKIIATLICLALTLGMISALAEETPAWMPNWDRDADVVVVGFGPAGAMAAKAAQENGASTLILEKASKEYAGGSAPASMGFIKPYTAEEICSSAMGRMTMEEAQRMFDKENELLDWMTQNGLNIVNSTSEGNGPGFYDVVVKGIEALGIEVLYETPAVKLICDPETKEVYGVQCQQADGSDLYVRANKGVVLCTGGYAANKDLMTRFHFADMIDYALAGAPTQTGDGLLMAVEIGAGLDGVSNQQIEWYGYSYKVASDEMGTAILHMGPSLGPDSRIFVNTNGERFMDEEMYIVHSKCQMPFLAYDGTFPIYNGYFNLSMYVIFDQAMFEAGPVGPRDYWCGYASMYDIYNWSEDNQAELDRGWFVKADTIDELVEKLAAQSGNDPIDVENLKKTIEAYNAGCAEQSDAFGRSEFYLDPIGDGPYYAAQILPTVVYTIGGLSGGPNGETLDWEGNPIPRLYHAGDVGQPTKILIAALQGALATGDIAGTACSQLASH